MVHQNRRRRPRRAVHERDTQVRRLRLAARHGLGNSSILGPYSAGAIGDLKDRVDGNIYVSGSGILVRALLADGLVDGPHLFVYPLALGAGQRLFPDTGPVTKFALTGSEAYDNGVLYLTYTLTAPGGR